MRGQTQQAFQQAAELETARESHRAVQRALLAKGPVVPEAQKSAVAKGIAEQKTMLAKLGFAAELQEFFSESNSYQLGDAEARLPPIDLPETRMEAGINNYGQPFNNSASQEINLMKKKPFHEVVAERLIEQLQQGTAPWQKPWNPGESGAFLPYNPVTGNRYKGINSIHLLSQDRDDQRWMTYKQATEAGAQVRKGEKGTGIQYWKFTDEDIKKDDDGKPVLDDEGNPVKVVVQLERPRGFFAMVFNGEQIDGLPPIRKQEHTWDPIERAEGILTASGADIHHNGGSGRFTGH